MADSTHTTESADEAIGFIQAFTKDGIKLKNVTIAVEWERTIDSSPDK